MLISYRRQAVSVSGLAFAVIAALASPAFAASPTDKPCDTPPSHESALVSTRLRIGGEVEQPLDLAVGDLAAMKAANLHGVPVICSTGATLSTNNAFHGVLLRDLLNRAKPKMPGHFDKNHLVIVATATDGYQVLFTWHELFNSPTGDAVLVFYQENGKPLDAREGQIALISAKDTKTGPRKVRNLQAIDVRRI
jgi:hypothetical protein